MRLAKLKITGFRCFGDTEVVVEFDDLSAFVGANGSGKSAVLMALARMFGATAALRTLTKDDFHLAPDSVAPDQLDLHLEASFEFPELMDDHDVDKSAAVPECLRHIVAKSDGAVPTCRIQLRATWTKTASPEGDIEAHLEWIDSLEDPPAEDSIHDLRGVERSLIQLVYVPAARDAVRELRAVSGTILSRVLQHIEWPDEVKDELLELSEKMADSLRREQAFNTLEKALQDSWENLRGAGFGSPELSVAETDLSMLLRRIDPQLVRSEKRSQSLNLLSEGERSLLYFALVASSLEFEAKQLAKGGGTTGAMLPVLTILAVEEPENHLAPHYLSRILRTLRAIEKHRNAQVILTSHSASILRRVEPSEIRHFRIAGNLHVVAKLTLPDDTVEAFKYVREAVRAHPELYFSRVVVLGEGPSEEVVLPRIAKAFSLDVDPRFITVVPLGGRHVHHFWRLLYDLGIPFVTLLDLDTERSGGCWGRIKGINDELLQFGEKREDVLGSLSIDEHEQIADLEPVSVQDEALQSWLNDLERKFDVFFSAPLDIDLALLTAFRSTYKGLAPEGRGPRKLPAKEPQRAKRLLRLARSVLGADGGTGETFESAERALFSWYSYLFIAGSKPVSHARAFAELDDNVISQRCPDVLRRLVARVKELAGYE